MGHNTSGSIEDTYIRSMPIWIYLSNLVVLKKAVAEKYPGGLAAFRIDHEIGNGNSRQQEDAQLFSLSAMGPDLLQSDAGRLIDMGFNFDEVDSHANELAILTRYGGIVARPAWLEFNAIYIWHTQCSPALVAKARSIEAMSMDEFTAKQEAGEFPYGALVEENSGDQDALERPF